MLITTDFRGCRVLVLGLGLFGGGASTARWLVEHGARVTVTDLKTARQLQPTIRRLRSLPIRYVLGQHRFRDIAESDLIIRNPDVREDSPFVSAARRLGIPVETDTSLFFTFCPSPIIGVTGTKGKSTTVAMTAALVRTRFARTTVGGNIGVPQLAVLQRAKPGQPVVIELSSWQLEGLTPHGLSPHIAVITNIMPDHLNRYRSFAAYAEVKRSIVGNQQPGDVAIVNADDPQINRLPIPLGVRLLRFSIRRPADAFVHRGALWLSDAGRKRRVIPASVVRQWPQTWYPAALAAMLAATSVGADPAKYASVLRRFRGLPGRLERVRTINGATWVNDTTATDPDAVRAALRTTRGRIILIAGGVDKALPYASLAWDIRRRVSLLVLLPGSASLQLLKHLRNWPHRHCALTMPEAVTVAAAAARPMTTILLSPGAASFNLFRHEFDRGRTFTRLVRRLRI